MIKITICIDVPDMDQAIQFYTKALGFDLVEEKTEHSELSANGVTVYLGCVLAGTNPLFSGDIVRDYKRHWTPVHLDVIVTDLNDCVAAIVKMGGIKEGEKSGDWGAIAFCADPFGNGFCVMQHNK